MTTYNPQTGKLSEGTDPAEPLVPMLGPGGSDRKVPRSQVQLFSESGYKVDTPEARQEIDLQHQYGDGLGNELLAAGAGAARSLSFGLSDLALTRTGITSPQTLDELRKRNPDATLAGELGAFVVPGIGSALSAVRGAGVLARGAGIGMELSGAGISGLSKLSGALGSAAAKATGSTLVGSAAQAAAESFAFNVAHNISEAVLGDQQLTAEKILAHSGRALFVGAGLGVGVPLAGRMIRNTATKARDAIDSFGQALKNDILPKMGDAAAKGYAKGFASMTGKGPEAENEIVGMLEGSFTPTGMKKREEIIHAIDKDAFDETVRSFTQQLDDMHRATQQAVKRGFNEVRPKEVSKLLDGVDMDPALSDVGRLINTVQATAKKMADDPLLYDQTYMRELEKIGEQLEQRAGSTAGGGKVGFKSAEDIWTAINDIKSSAIGDLAKKPVNAGRATMNAVSEVQKLYGEFKNHLENPQLYGDAAASATAWNDAYSTMQQLLKKNKFTGKGGEFKREFLDVDGNVSADKALAFLRKIGAGRDRDEIRALEDYMSAAHTMVDQIDKSAAGVGIGTINREGFESILKKMIDTKTKAAADNAFVSKVRQQDMFGMALLNFQKSIGEHLATGGIFNATVRLAEKASSPFGVVKALSAAEGFAMNTSGRIIDAVDRFAGAAARAGAKAANRARPYAEPASINVLMNWLGGLAMGKVGDLSPDEKEKKPRTRREAFSRTAERLATMTADPAATASSLAEGVEHLAPHAPQTAQAVVNTQLRAISFLNDKAPKNPSADQTLNPFIVQWQPADRELAKFERYAAAVQDPLGVLDELESGSVSPESAEALQAVYPGLFEELKMRLVERTSELKTQVPYRDRLVLSLLFGVTLDPSLDSGFVNAIQNGYGQSAAQEPPTPSAYRPTSAAQKLGALEETPAQRIARR